MAIFSESERCYIISNTSIMRHLSEKHGIDFEAAHVEADEILCRVLELLGCEELVEEYEKIEKEYA